ncbi:MAG TPA: MerR family transcriptional regulator [Ferruginibacter sp.]|nr:MerR family transcriptional regulator [Ferruginibacter sp.]
MESFTIKDLENLSGIKAHTIRIWEQRYSFLKPSRTCTNIRFYCNEQLKKLLNVALLNKYGFKISHIDKMSEAEIREKILSLNPIEAQQERVVNELIRHMVDVDMDKFEAVLDNYCLVKGMEKTVIQIIFPFLEKLGVLWLTNHIIPAQEHLVSNIIRQKLIAGIDSIKVSGNAHKKILLFLPEGEFHEIALLFMQYLLKSRGICAIYLGCSVPLDDVEYVARVKQPDYLFTHLTSVGPKFNIDKFLATAKSKFPAQPMIISGKLAHSAEKKIQPPVRLLRSFPDALDFVSGL